MHFCRLDPTRVGRGGFEGDPRRGRPGTQPPTVPSQRRQNKNDLNKAKALNLTMFIDCYSEFQAEAFMLSKLNMNLFLELQRKKTECIHHNINVFWSRIVSDISCKWCLLQLGSLYVEVEVETETAPKLLKSKTYIYVPCFQFCYRVLTLIEWTRPLMVINLKWATFVRGRVHRIGWKDTKSSSPSE